MFTVCAQSTPMQHHPPHPPPTPRTSPAQKCSWTTCFHRPAEKGREFNGTLCQTAPRMSVWSSMDPGYSAKAKGNGLGSLVLRCRCVQVPWTSYTPFHSTPFWSESRLWHLFSSVTFPLGAVVKGPGTLVWHPDCEVSFWAEKGSPDNVASQPCLQQPQGIPPTTATGVPD